MIETLIFPVGGLLFALLAYFWALGERKGRSAEMLELKKGYVGQIALLQRELEQLVRDNEKLRRQLHAMQARPLQVQPVLQQPQQPKFEPQPLQFSTMPLRPAADVPPPDNLDGEEGEEDLESMSRTVGASL